MKNAKIVISEILLVCSIISVLFTAMIPKKQITVGQLFVKSFDGVYAAMAFAVFFVLYMVSSKNITEDNVAMNRLKFALSCSFLISLCTNIFF